MAWGAGKSGNPCDRFTPPYSSLRRVISRMTDSVNCVAFLDPVSLDMRWRFYAALRVVRAEAFFFFFFAGAFPDADDFFLAVAFTALAGGRARRATACAVSASSAP